MPKADGSVVLEVNLNVGKAEKDLAKLTDKIQDSEKAISEKEAERSPLVEEMTRYNQELEKARAHLATLKDEQAAITEAMQPGAAPEDFIAASANQEKVNAAVAETERLISSTEKKWASVSQKVGKYDRQLEKARTDLARMQEEAGGLVQQIDKANSATGRMAASMDRAGKNMAKSMDRFALRLREVMRSAVVFTLITQALANFREWMGRVIQTNDEAAAAIAKLKGALLTMAQPLVDIVIPAFVTLVNALTRIVSTIAQLFAMLTGTTVEASKEAAAALDKEADALENTGEAAKEAAKPLAGFDEINRLTTGSAGGGGGGAASEIAPDFSFESNLEEGQLQNILRLVELIGAAFLTWKISSALKLGLSKTLQLALAIYSAVQFVRDMLDAWTNGVNLDNLLGMLAGAAGLALGLGFAFGRVAAGISLVVTGISMLVTGFKDAFENGWNAYNLFLSIAGILATGLGIGLITGTWIPALIAAIAALLLNWTVHFGQGEELLEGLKTVAQGVVDFFTGIFTGDIGMAVDAVSTIFDGLGMIVTAVITAIKTAFLSFFDWLDENTGGRFSGIISVIKGLIIGVLDAFLLAATGLVEALGQVFSGLIEFITGVFTGDWDLAWHGVQNIFKGIWNGIVSILESAVNLIIKGVNWLISQLNKISFEVPDWVPEVGGKSIGINIPKVQEITIPRLAAGAVIPPNREFMAVLGDQASGTNIEAPLATIEQAVENVLRRMGTGGGVTITVKPAPGLTRYLKYELDAETTRQGGKLVGVTR